MLTEKEMIDIIKNKKIDKCTEDEKRQINAFAFGEEFMQSDNKGRRVECT